MVPAAVRGDGLSGRVHQISISPGGVPKLAVPEAWVSSMGLAGDGHNDSDHHGGPDRAVCLFSLELIEALQAEGHPIFAGATGENLTLTGVDWPEMVPGSRWNVGSEIDLEVTSYTTPCLHQVDWFLNGDYGRINQKLRPGWSRVYARVLSEGQVRVGDLVERASP